MGVGYYDNHQTIEGFLDDAPSGISTGTTLHWFTLGNLSGVTWYPVNTSANSCSQIATAINALAVAPNSTCPILAYAFPTSTGSITQNSADSTRIGMEYSFFSDGLNYVQTSTAPALNTGNYTLTFKDPIASFLAGPNTDWADEEVRLVPTNMATLAAWMNASAVTGLFNNATIQTSSGGHKLVIASDTVGSAGAVQVQGGTANFASAPVENFGSSIAELTITSGFFLVTSVLASTGSITVNPTYNGGYSSLPTYADGLSAGQWVALQNSRVMPRTYPITSATVLQSINAQGYVNVSAQPVANILQTVTAAWQVEAQGEFVAYSWAGVGTQPNLSPSIYHIGEACWVYITTLGVTATDDLPLLNGVDASGQLLRIVRTDPLASVFWVENPSFVPNTGWASVTFLVTTASSLGTPSPSAPRAPSGVRTRAPGRSSPWATTRARRRRLSTRAASGSSSRPRPRSR